MDVEVMEMIRVEVEVKLTEIYVSIVVFFGKTTVH